MPRMKFADILSNVRKITNVTSQDDLIKYAIQRGLDKATSVDLPYLMTDGVITTVAPYETGTVATTNNSTAVVGTDTVWTAAMAGRKIRIGSDTAYYRIASVTDGTNLVLEVVYQGTAATAATYSIYKDEYKLPADCNAYKVMRQIENGVAMTGVEASAFDLYVPAPSSKGSPNLEILIGTKLDVYNTGTVSGTLAASVITGASTAWTGVEGLGRGSRITVGSYVYTVKSVDSDTQITIYETLAVAIAALTTYTVSLDNLRVQFFSIPDAIENIYFRYQRIPAPLIGDTDLPDLPDNYHHILVTAGEVWAWATKDKEEATKKEALFNLELSDMWAKIGNISLNRVYHRRSQDDIPYSLRSPIYPSNYGVPFSR